MNKQEWKEIVKKTKIASKKRTLTKKELNDLSNAQIALNKLGLYKDPAWVEGSRKEKR